MVSGKQIAQLAHQPLQDHWGYIWGTSGCSWTQASQAQIEKTTNDNYQLARKYGWKWIGRKVCDCSGLLVWIARQLGLTIPHGSNSIWKGELSRKGVIQGDPPVGAFVFKLRNGNDYYHVGVYIGDGKVIEAKNTYNGVVESKLSEWSHYGLWKLATFDDNVTAEVIPLQGRCTVDVPNDGSLNVRSAPNGSKTGTIREGDPVTVLENRDGWSKISYQCEGWVMSKFLRKEEQA
jgi:hypothetical protein